MNQLIVSLSHHHKSHLWCFHLLKLSLSCLSTVSTIHYSLNPKKLLVFLCSLNFLLRNKQNHTIWSLLFWGDSLRIILHMFSHDADYKSLPFLLLIFFSIFIAAAGHKSQFHFLAVWFNVMNVHLKTLCMCVFNSIVYILPKVF